MLPSSVPTIKVNLSKVLKSKHKPHASEINEVSSSLCLFSKKQSQQKPKKGSLLLLTSFNLMTSSGSNLSFIRLQFITLPSEEIE